MRRAIGSVFVMVMVAGLARPLAQGQTAIAHIRDLYANAAYEDVLSAVAADATASPEVGQYKVFSLIALGRAEDAEKAAEAVLDGHLTFHPDSDAAPRLLDVFASARRRVAPDVLRSMYVDAKSAYDRKDRDAAISAFGELVSIAADPDLKDDKAIVDLGLLANGFLELSRAMPAAGAPPSSGSVAPKPAAKPELNASRPAIVSAPLAVASPPKPLHEEMPRWLPPAELARAQYRGRILVHIGVDGRVASAEMIESVNPLYDDLLLRASKSWSYQPGLSNGKPVSSDRIVEVVLKPR